MKHRSTRERLEAEMRLRNSVEMLKRLQHGLKTRRHLPGDPYWKAMHAQFWQKLSMDKRIAKGEI
jgi:hypothetical protein